MTSLKYGLMLFPFQHYVYYFDISCRYRLRTYNHTKFVTSQGKQSFHWRGHASKTSVSVEKKNVFLLSLKLLWAQLDFSVKNWGSLSRVRWEEENDSHWALSNHVTIIKYPHA